MPSRTISSRSLAFSMATMISPSVRESVFSSRTASAFAGPARCPEPGGGSVVRVGGTLRGCAVFPWGAAGPRRSAVILRSFFPTSTTAAAVTFPGPLPSAGVADHDQRHGARQVHRVLNEGRRRARLDRLRDNRVAIDLGAGHGD